MRTTDAELAELLGRNVRGLRNQRGLRQEELAKQLGWSRPKLTELEQGKKPRLTLMDVIALCGELGVSLATLLQGAEGAEARQLLGVQRDEVVQAQVDELQSHYAQERRHRLAPGTPPMVSAMTQPQPTQDDDVVARLDAQEQRLRAIMESVEALVRSRRPS